MAEGIGGIYGNRKKGKKNLFKGQRYDIIIREKVKNGVKISNSVKKQNSQTWAYTHVWLLNFKSVKVPKTATQIPVSGRCISPNVF